MKNMKKNYGPWGLVTGASSGIGKSMSEQLAEQGLNLVIVARNESKLDALKGNIEKRYNVQVKTISADLSTHEGNQRVTEQTEALDIGLLVANAGIENNGPFIENDLDEERKLAMLNMLSPMMLSQAFARRFVKRGKGGILFISSLFGYQGVPFVANYSASKAYILSLGEALNVELQPLGIDVTVLSPGMTKTPMTEKMTVDFNKMPISQHTSSRVASIGLNALGHKATVVPGLMNKFYAWENRFIPRSWPVKLFGILIARASTDKGKGYKKRLNAA